MDKEQKIAELCEQLKKGRHVNNWKVIAELREKGWLTDGSLSGVHLTDVNLFQADMRGANLSGAFLSKINLGGANLSGANLSHTHLDQANLNEADLSLADLSGARLWRANLIQANLNKAKLLESYLSNAKLRGADLREADLHKAILESADLSKAEVDNANFKNSIFAKTVLADIDLSKAKSLETVTHLSSSHVSTNTLFKSQGNIPEIFLWGCGLPKILIQNLPSMMDEATQYYSCFIIYEQGQKDFAQQLHKRLKAKNIHCWLDEKTTSNRNQYIRSQDRVLLCCSEETLASRWMHNELRFGFEREQQLTNQTIIPLDLDGHLFRVEWQSGYEVQLKERLVADFTEWKNEDKFEAAFQQVLKALRTDEGHEIPPPSRL